VPGQWTWNCSDEFRVAGTAAFFNRSANGEVNKMGESGLGLADPIVYTRLGSSAGSPTNVNCTPEHLSLTYTIDYLVREEGSYLDLNIATAQKPAASAPHATVTTEAVTVNGAAKDAARFTMTAKNDSTTPMSDFTINAGRSRGQAQVAALTCDLTAFGGEVVSANGPAESLTVPSGKATVPSGKEITCQVDLTDVVGRNTVTAGITTDGQSFAANYVDNRPVGEVTAQSSQNSTEAAPTGTSQIVVEYTVTFTNKTGAGGRTSDIVLRPPLPAGIALRNVWGTGVPWRVDVGAYMLQEDGSIPLPTGDPMPGDSTTTMTFWNTYEVNADAITEEEWEALGTCNPKDPSKGLTTQIDVADSGAGIEAKSFAVCTTVTRAKN